METNQMMKTQVYNLVILDKSGSMESIRKEAVDGYNETLNTIRVAQKKHADTQEHFVSLAAFCGCGIEMIYDKTPIAQAEPLKPEQYEPCCVTPLFDAIGSSIKKLKKELQTIEDSAVVVTIITDGYENASKEWKGDSVKKLIDECKKEGWVFAFIGAGEEITQVASTISISNTIVWEKSEEGTKAMFEETNDASARFFDKMAAPCCVGASVGQRKKMRQAFADAFYKK